MSYYRKNVGADAHEFFSVFHNESGCHIGHFEIKAISRKFRLGTLAHVLIGDQSYRGKGLGKVLVDLMVRVCFEHLNLYRISLAVHVTNHAAIAAYIRGGFLVEGVVRDVISRGDDRYSLYQMSLLKPEWRPAT